MQKTVMNISAAKQIDIVEFLGNEGYKPKKTRGNTKWFLSPIHDETEPSFKVDTERNEWFDYGLNEGGDIIDIAMKIYNLNSVSDALKKLDEKAATIVNRIMRYKTGPPRSQVSNDMRNIQYVPLTHFALLHYMMKRKVDINIGKVYCCEVHYDIRGSHYFGIAFRNRVGGFEIRNQYYKGCVGHKDITYFPITKEKISEHCPVFEGFMDFLSYLTLKESGDNNICIEKDCDIIVLNTVHNLKKATDLLTQYPFVHSYMDNDDAGQRTFQTMQELFGQKVENESVRFQPFNDLNDYLVKQSATVK